MTTTIDLYPSVQKLLMARAIVANKRALTLPFKDPEGRVIQIWQSHTFLFGTVHGKDGSILIIPPAKIINALDPHSSLSALCMGIETKWHLTFYGEKITIWPPIAAAGNPYFHEGKAGHIFDSGKMIKGHFPVDTPANREKILNIARNPANQVGTDKFGNTIYMKTQPDGKQIWVEVRSNGMVNNGGVNYLPKRWVADPKNPRGGSYEDVLALTHQPSDFQERVQTNRLVDSYNSSHPDTPMPEGKATGGHIGGVGNAVGIIKGLFETVERVSETEHLFYLPSVNEKLSLTKKEIDQLLHELAVGIFVHDTVPFFSLHFNGDTNMYPVIHPAYQNTYVGHVIALLDYYMKGFVNGGFYKNDFVLKWNQERITSEPVLRSQIVDVFEYSKPYLKTGETYLSVKEAMQKLEVSGQIPKDPNENPLLKDFSGFRSSFRIIAKQDSIKKTENLFVIDGDFDVLYTISPDPVYQKELAHYKQEYGKNPPSYEALEKSYQMMCQQIKYYMPRLPEFKKLFEALNLINFFCYYYNTLKKENKFPLIERTKEDNGLKCPPLFPHLPLREFYYGQTKVTLDDITSTLTTEENRSFIEDLAKGVATQGALSLITRAMCSKVKANTRVTLSAKHSDPTTYEERAKIYFNRLKELYRECYNDLKKDADKAAQEGLVLINEKQREYNLQHDADMREWEGQKQHYSELTSAFLASWNQNYQTNVNNLKICNDNLKFSKIIKRNSKQISTLYGKNSKNGSKIRQAI